jgi:hypothetical protein
VVWIRLEQAGVDRMGLWSTGVGCSTVDLSGLEWAVVGCNGLKWTGVAGMT